MATQKYKRGRIQQGGVVLREQRDNPYIPENELKQIQRRAFSSFFKNSNILLLSANSKGGVLFKMDLNDGIDSPYVLCRSQSPWTPVRSLLLKLCCFSSYGFFLYKKNNSDFELNSLNPREFLNEVNIQKEIYSASLDDKLEPICPSIVHYSLVDVSEKDTFLDGIIKKINDKTKMINMFSDRSEIYGLGFIVMEYLEGFEPIFNLLEKPTMTPKMKKHYNYCVCYEMIRMYNLTGYLHGDFHQHNFMVNTSYSYFSDNAEFSGRAIIIDFGSSFKPPLKRKIALNYEDETDTGAIPILKLNLEYKTPTIKESFVVGDWPSYQWLEPFFIDDMVAEETEIKLIEYDAMRNRFIEFWMQTIGGGTAVEEPSIPMNISPVAIKEPVSHVLRRSSRIATLSETKNHKKKGGQTMDALYLQPYTTEMKPTTYHVKNNKPTIQQPTIMKKSTTMFPSEFAGKFKEIQQYVAMDKAANEPNK